MNKKILQFKNLYLSILVVCCIMSYSSLTNAAASDIADIATNAAVTAFSEDNEKIKNDIIKMIADDTVKQQLNNYIVKTRPVIEEYREKIQTATTASIWFEQHIPLVGGVISSIIMTATYHFYESDLKELATDDVSKRFCELRNAGIDVNEDLTERFISYSAEEDRNGTDWMLTINVAIMQYQQKTIVEYIKEIAAAGVSISDADIDMARF